jgi:hypothetical protein
LNLHPLEINESSLFTAASEISTADSEGKISVPVLDKKTAYDVGEVDESSFLSAFGLFACGCDVSTGSTTVPGSSITAPGFACSSISSVITVLS